MTLPPVHNKPRIVVNARWTAIDEAHVQVQSTDGPEATGAAREI